MESFMALMPGVVTFMSASCAWATEGPMVRLASLVQLLRRPCCLPFFSFSLLFSCSCPPQTSSTIWSAAFSTAAAGKYMFMVTHEIIAKTRGANTAVFLSFFPMARFSLLRNFLLLTEIPAKNYLSYFPARAHRLLLDPYALGTAYEPYPLKPFNHLLEGDHVGIVYDVDLRGKGPAPNNILLIAFLLNTQEQKSFVLEPAPETHLAVPVFLEQPVYPPVQYRRRGAGAEYGYLVESLGAYPLADPSPPDGLYAGLEAFWLTVGDYEVLHISLEYPRNPAEFEGLCKFSKVHLLYLDTGLERGGGTEDVVYGYLPYDHLPPQEFQHYHALCGESASCEADLRD